MNARRWNCCFVWSLVFAASVALAASRPAAAGELDKLDTSLKLIPADAAFYSSMMRNREQFEAIKKSNACVKVLAMPIVQKAIADFTAEMTEQGNLAQLQAALENPETRKALDLFVEMASHEMFVYGDKDFADFVDLFQSANAAQSFGPMLAQITGQTNDRKPNEIQAAAIVSVLAKHADQIRVPNLVVGFKVKNAELAKEQLIKLEMIANILAENSEVTKGRIKKTKVGDFEYLVLNLDGSMLPWDEISEEQFKEMGADENNVKKVIEQLKKAKLVVALGLRGDYLVASVGSSLEALEKLGKGDRLIDRVEFKPLVKYADRRLVSISYASEAINQRLNNQPKSIDNLLETGEQLLATSDLKDEQKDRIRKDAKSLSADLKTLFPKAGAAMALSFLTDRGLESYQYAWGDHNGLDGSKPLGLLEHIGGNPLFGVVARQKCNVKDYDLLVKWLKTGYGYFREFGLPLMEDDDREKVETFTKAALPLVERLDKANREMLFPALADGQFALVVDARLTSKQFIASLPATEKPMPMLEPALVIGVSDAKLLEKGLGEYRAVVNGLIDAMRQVEDVHVPANFKIPEPQVTETADGKIFAFTLPEPWGVDKKIVPNLAISDKVAVVSISREHTGRLLKATPPALGGVLAKSDRPLAVAVWFQWAGTLDAAMPWIDFAVEKAVADQDDKAEKKAVVDQVRTGVDVFKTLRTVTDEGYIEDGALVNHSMLEIQDVGK